MSRYQSSSVIPREPVPDPPLPQGFTSIKDLLDDSSRHNQTVSVIGVVSDYMLPTRTKGSGEKVLPHVHAPFAD